MFKKVALVATVLFALLMLAMGLGRLQFTADIFGLLPQELPVIKALSDYQKGFKREQELLISVSAESARQADKSAANLAQRLQQQQLAQQVIWQNPAEQDTDVLAELLALQWLNVPPPQLQQLATKMAPANAPNVLQEAQQQAWDADDPFAALIGLSDPFGLAELSATNSLEDSANLFASADGRFRVLYLTPPASISSLASWASAVKAEVEGWQLEHPNVQLGVTGTPVFNQELGQSLGSDMLKAVLGTMVLVGLLFAWAHRRLLPLLWLLALLGLVLSTTVAIGGQLLGPLNIISLGYAAVLMGLAADYGLLLYQAHTSNRQAVKATVKQVAPSILWAALTTSVAFLMVSRGSLPGMAQLGSLVAIGIAVAAVFMLAFYLWPLRRSYGAGKVVPVLLTAKAAKQITLLLLLVAVGLLLWRQPSLNTDPKTLGPKKLEARALQTQIDDALEREDDAVFVLFSAADKTQGAAQIQQAMQAVEQRLQTAERAGVVSAYNLPRWWPNAENQAQNRAVMMGLSQRWPDLKQEAEALDYPVDGMAISDAIMAQFAAVAARLDIGLPQQPGTAWLFGQTAAVNFAEEDALAGFYAVAQVALADGISKLERDALAADINAIAHAQMAGWPFASAGLLGAMQGDFKAVALPMLLLLLLVLFMAFRGWKEVLFSLTALALTLLVLSAVMATLGWQWNLMNMLALPLLVGVTVDYSIHTQLALQRFNGNLRQVYQHVGRAIALAGITTAIGFSSLIFANSEGLSGLGRVASVGVILACFISVMLQPHWWRAWHAKRLLTSTS